MYNLNTDSVTCINIAHSTYETLDFFFSGLKELGVHDPKHEFVT